MYKVALNEATTQLAKLIEDVARGEDVIITRPDGAAFRLVPVPTDITAPKLGPKFGSAQGLIRIADDFDEPIEGFEDYMP